MAQLTNGHANGTADSTASLGVQFDTIEDAVRDIRDGKFVIVLDDPGRENEGDLIIAGEKVTEESMAFMVRYTSGVICAPIPPSVCERLNLPLMVAEDDHTEAHGTKYTVSIDARARTTTGISAADRALTLNLIANPKSAPNEFVRPGHMFPLRYKPGGVLVRRGHTEASVDLCRLAGLQPVAAICELVLDNGKMMRRDDCAQFAKEHNIKFITIDDLARYIEAKVKSEGIDWTIE